MIRCLEALSSPTGEFLVLAFTPQLIPKYLYPLLLGINHVVEKVVVDRLPHRSCLADETSFYHPGLVQGLCVDEDGPTKLAREREEGIDFFYCRRMCRFGGLRRLPLFGRWGDIHWAWCLVKK